MGRIVKRNSIFKLKKHTLFLKNRLNSSCYRFLTRAALLFAGWLGWDFAVSMLSGKQPFDPQNGNFYLAVAHLVLYVTYSLFAGTLAGFLYDRCFLTQFDLKTLKSLPAKPLIYHGLALLLLAGILSGWIVWSRQFWYILPYGFEQRLYEFVTLDLVCLSAIFTGIVANRLFPVPKWAILFTFSFWVINFMISSIPFTAPGSIANFSLYHWAFKSLAITSGLGADIARDDCWKFPVSLQEAMSEADKAFLGCNCKGRNLLAENNCNLPGLHVYLSPAIDLPMPVQPESPGPPPAEPSLPKPPSPPVNQEDPVLSDLYNKELQAYQEEIQQINKVYQLLLISYQIRAELYRTQLEEFQTEWSNWVEERNKAIQSAEETIANYQRKFGWAFVNFDNRYEFYLNLMQTWAVLFVFTASLGLLTILSGHSNLQT